MNEYTGVKRTNRCRRNQTEADRLYIVPTQERLPTIMSVIFSVETGYHRRQPFLQLLSHGLRSVIQLRGSIVAFVRIVGQIVELHLDDTLFVFDTMEFPKASPATRRARETSYPNIAS